MDDITRALRFLSEAEGDPSTPMDFKKWLTAELAKEGITVTKAGRGGFHIRFPLDGTYEDFQNFFRDADIEVRDTDYAASGTFSSYELTLLRSNDVLTAPVSIIWVNNIRGGSQSDKNFGDKELTPDDLGLGGGTYSSSEEIIEIIAPLIKKKYPEHSEMLLGLVVRSAKAGSDVVPLDGIDLSKYEKDLPTISKNFGEILAGIWSFSNMSYETVNYPAVSNAALVDYYGEVDGVEQPVSIKSGGGSKVTINNIVDALDDKVKAGKVNLEEEKAYDVFQIVKNYDMINSWIELHKYFNSRPINELADITDIPKDQIEKLNLYEWVKDKDVEELKSVLIPWHESIGKKVKPDTWKLLQIKKLKENLWPVVSPLGEWMTSYLNTQQDILDSMNNLANLLQMIQLNIDVKTKKMYIKVNNFGDADFVFGWAGYKGGNKLGFKMKT